MGGLFGSFVVAGNDYLDNDISADLVVGDDVLEDGGTAGAGPVLEGGDGGSDHDAVLGVGGRSLLGFGSSSRHVDCFGIQRRMSRRRNGSQPYQRAEDRSENVAVGDRRTEKKTFRR